MATMLDIDEYSSASGPRSNEIQKPPKTATVASTMQRSASGARATIRGRVNAR